MSIRFRVAELAKKKGLTGYAITKKIGATHPHVGYRLLKVDDQDSISKETIERICVALDCEPKDFIVREQDAVSPQPKTPAARKRSSRK